MSLCGITNDLSLSEMQDNDIINNVDASVVELSAINQNTKPGGPRSQPVDRFDFLGDAEVTYRETEDGEEKRALISDLFKIQQESGNPVWLKLCARDQYGYKVHAWRPCRLGLFGYVDVP